MDFVFFWSYVNSIRGYAHFLPLTTSNFSIQYKIPIPWISSVWKPQKIVFFFFRLSYHQRVVDSVPGSFRGFAPDKPDPTFKYEALPETENNMTCMISAKLVNAIKQKCAPEDIQAILKEIPDDEGSDQAACLRVSNSKCSFCTIFSFISFSSCRILFLCKLFWTWETRAFHTLLLPSPSFIPR